MRNEGTARGEQVDVTYSPGGRTGGCMMHESGTAHGLKE